MKHKKLLLILMLTAFMLTGCQRESRAPSGHVGMYVPETSTPPPAETQSDAPTRNAVLALYFDKDMSCNPLLSTSTLNLALSGLMYEGLFKLNSDFSYEPVLCESWETQDSQSYHFTLKESVYFHDGSELGINDVVSSLNMARESGRYINRLSIISELYSSGNEIVINLRHPNSDFPALLDIPIMKETTRYGEEPIGTGPYALSYSGNTASLNAFVPHRNFESLMVVRFNLVPYDPAEQVYAFENGLVDIVVTNKSSFGYVEYSSDCEKREVETTRMHFVGFNAGRGFCASGARRLILSSLIDRNYLTTTVYDGMLQTVLPVHPRSAYYLEDIASSALIKEGFLADYMARQTVGDYDDDGFIEYIEGTRIEKFTLEFIVNNENLKKVAAAKQIAERLRSAGFDVKLIELSWSAFLNALENGEYDLYYGEVMLTPDFDLSSLLCGGRASYGLYDSQLQSRVYEFIGAAKTEKAEAANQLLRYFCDTAPIAPLFFERQTLFSHRGAVQNMNPSSQNVFNDISNWS